MTPTRLGALAGILTLAADQVSKVGLLRGYDLPLREPLVLGPFLNLIVVWNRGISYGLFQQSSEVGRLILAILSFAAVVAISIWLTRVKTALLALALGLIGGGAVGNAIDRLAYGAVFDFAQLHVGERSWYVFNVADVAIVAGVVGLVWDSLADRGRPLNTPM